MKIELISLAALACSANASPAALDKRNPAITADAVAFTGNTVDTTASLDYTDLGKRATLRGDCSPGQKETIRTALYNCYRVAGRAAAVADTNHAKLKEFFKPDSNTNTGPKYTARVAKVVTAVFEKVQKACGNAEGSWSTAQINCERTPGLTSGCHVRNAMANTNPHLLYPDGSTPYGIISICPKFFDRSVHDLVNEEHPEAVDRVMAIIHEMTKIKAVKGTREITPAGNPDDLIGLGASSALVNAASYAFFAQAVKYPEEHWTPFPGIQ